MKQFLLADVCFCLNVWFLEQWGQNDTKTLIYSVQDNTEGLAASVVVAIPAKQFVLRLAPTNVHVGATPERGPEDTAAHMLPMRSLNVVPLLRGSMHDCAYWLSSTSTPCAHSITQSCLVSPGAWRTASLLFKRSLASVFTPTCVSHRWWWFPLFFFRQITYSRKELYIFCV